MIPIRKTLSTSDIQLSYLEWNQGQEPLILLHGMADHALVWSSLGDYLKSDYHIIAPDMRGHGESSKPEKDYSFKSAISDLEALMDKMRWSAAHIVSHSWTGKLAAIWARENPARLKSITLVDPIFIWKMPSFLKIIFPLLYRVLPSLKSMGPFTSYEAAEQTIKQLSQYQNWSSLQQQVFQAAIAQKPDGTWGSKFTIAARDGIFDAVMEVPGFIHPVDTPALFIQPEKGVNRQNWQIQPYKTNLKNLLIRQVPGNHWPFLTNPTEFNQIVASFLAAQK
ncbi:alpha/beta hydrolase [Dolichospermum circinale CS-1225]|uniref:Alpha/beta hydrolase n=1 Tax=Dolichospermum circinale CS-537/01 TaxID=3021739 RepID=A0ABT5A5Z7_9CYAN|nr:alpha/beta hydrolase [Dolichospermum circinale]MDB9458085.1 alpha/beta hydrolase [Dolichospermum circinale CS-545/17]MDB9487357.1 alpha/beta hydrolase [Dolichospermum circinale CS-537/01]MDB9522009.1 alpha/beta hydrolase [Dolichospermum circinale CS-1225]